MNPDLYTLAYGEDVVTFFLYNLSGQIVGFQQYRPAQTNKKCNHPRDSRYFTYLTEGVDGVFGLETLSDGGTLLVVEGVFKAATLHRLGFNAVAVLTSSPKRMKSLFRVLKRKYKVVALGDNDPAGKQLVNFVGYGEVSDDLDELPDEQVLKLVEKYT